MAITFNEAYYLQNNPDVVVAVSQGVFKSGQDHYIRFGAKELRDPNAIFDAEYYASRNPDVVAAVSAGVYPSVFEHYLAAGVNEGRLPSAAVANFDSTRYLNDNADVKAAGISTAAAALKHYLQFGVDEGRAAYDTAGSLIVFNNQGGGSNSSFTLTNGTDVATANVFQAGLVYTPGGNDRINALQDEDVLNGSGTNPTLNATLGNSNDNGATVITPKLNGIQTLNLAFTGSGAAAVTTLDAQDSTGIQAVNISRITETTNLAHVRNMTSVPSNLSVQNVNAPTASVEFTFTNAGASSATNSTTLTVQDIAVDRVRVEENAAGAALDQGVETINFVSNGSTNQLGQYTVNQNSGVDGVTGRGFAAQDLTTLNLSGAAATTIINITNADSTLNVVDASKMTGALDINIASEVAAQTGASSGADIALKFTGGTAGDTIRVGTGLGSSDSIDGGTGTDTLRVYNNATSTLLNGTITNTEVLDIRVNDPLVGTFAAGATTLTANTALVGGLTSIVLRNDGSAASGGQVNFNLTNVSATVAGTAANTTLRHGTTGNNDLADTKVTFGLASTSGTSDTVAMTIVNDINTDTTSSFELGAANVENITIADSDTESNSMLLTNTANHTGTVTLTGGTAGRHFGVNVDVVAAASFNNFGGTSTTNLSDLSSAAINLAGGSVAAADVVAATVSAGTYTGNVAIRVGQPTTTNGPQAITTGSGNDLIVFNDDVDARAGLTISDTVNAGTGTDTLRLDSNRAAGVTLSSSEFTNVSGFEALQLRGTTAYNITLPASLTAGVTNFTVDHVDRSVANGAATIDARAVTNGLRFYGESSYDYTSAYVHSTTASSGQWAAVAERIILNDANTNGTVLIDGGDAVGRVQNADVLEVRNAAVVSSGDLAQVSDIGFLEFRSDAAVAQAYVLELNNTILDRQDSSQAATSAARETFTVRVVPNTDTLSSADTLQLDASTVTDAFNLTVGGSRGDNVVTLGAGNDTYVLWGGFAAGTYAGTDAAGRSLTGASDFNGATAGEGIRTATATESINLGTGTDSLVTYGAINLVAATLTGVENITANSALVISASQFNALTSLTFSGNTTHQLTIVDDIAGANTVDLSKITVAAGTLTYDITSASNATGGSVNNLTGSGTIGGAGSSVAGVVGTSPTNNGTAPTPSTTTTITVAGIYPGTSGTNDTFSITQALLTGTTINGNAADTETLSLSTAGMVALNNGAAGGTLTNIDALILANGTNSITFTAGSGISSVTGGTGDDTLAIANMTAFGTINLGGGADTLTVNTETLVATTSLIGGDGTDVLNVTGANTTLATASISGFETLTLNNQNVTLTQGQFGAFTTVTASAGTITFSNAGSVTLAANNPVYVLANGTNTVNASATANFNVTGGTGADSLSFGTALTANDTFNGGAGSDTLTVTGAATGSANITNVENLVITNTSGASVTVTTGAMAPGAASTINASTSTSAVVLDASAYVATTGVTITGGSANDTITISATDAQRLITNVNLSSGGSDTIVLNDVAHATTALTNSNQGATITGFQSGLAAGADKLQLQFAGTAATNFQSVSAAGTATTFASLTSVVEIRSGVGTATDFTLTADGGSIEGIIATAIGTNTNAGDFYVAIYGSGAQAGNVGIYHVNTTAAAADVTAGNTIIDLVGVVQGVAVDTLVLANFI